MFANSREVDHRASHCCDCDHENRNHTFVQLDVLGMPRAGPGQQFMYKDGPLNTALDVTTNDQALYASAAQHARF